jgi:hypothetical protein
MEDEEGEGEEEPEAAVVREQVERFVRWREEREQQQRGLTELLRKRELV